jgi:HEPN domain-containing protein
MPNDDYVPGCPQDWLRHARSDLALARVRSTEILLEILCFHTQQAAEKALKAVLVAKGIAPPKTHNLRTLLDLLPSDIVLPDDLQESSRLTDYAVMSRYPAALEPVNEDEYREAMRLAEAIVSWAEGIVYGSPCDRDAVSTPDP